MLLEQVAARLNTPPAELERESICAYLERRLRLVESEFFSLAHRYGVESVAELDQAVRDGRLSESEGFEDYFHFDFLESERDILVELREQL
jgi:hypothetical protein